MPTPHKPQAPQSCLEVLATDLGAHLRIHGIVITFPALGTVRFKVRRLLKLQASLSFRVAAWGLYRHVCCPKTPKLPKP